jgi:uncharacterized protein YndB with AHSA1/START domain
MPRDLRPVGPEFYDAAPYRYVYAAVIRAPLERVFEAIADDPAGWGGWFPGFSHDGHWTTPGPPGAGSRRTVRMAGVTYDETVLAWDRPHRFAFRVDRAGAPLAAALAEDYRIEGHPSGSTLEWVFALDPAAGLRPFLPLFDAALGRLFSRMAANLERVLRR